MLGKLKRKAAARSMGVSEKQIADLESMQREVALMEFKHEEGDVTVKVSGDMKIQYLSVDGESRDDIKKAINKAFEKSQKEMAKKMMGSMGGGGLSGLLGR